MRPIRPIFLHQKHTGLYCNSGAGAPLTKATNNQQNQQNDFKCQETYSSSFFVISKAYIISSISPRSFVSCWISGGSPLCCTSSFKATRSGGCTGAENSVVLLLHALAELCIICTTIYNIYIPDM